MRNQVGDIFFARSFTDSLSFFSGLINTSCYEEGWIFKIKIKDQKEVDELMDEKAYGEFLKTVH